MRESCIPGAGFYRAQDGLWVPFRCGSWSCPTCGPAKARRVKSGVAYAVWALHLKDMLTLTLPVGARGSTSTTSRTVLSRVWNAFATYLRSRGLLEEYVAVPEFHKDGTAHLHVACNVEALAIAQGHTQGHDREADAAAASKVQAFLSTAWGRLGGGFVWYGRGLAGWDSQEAARYIAKYIGKAQGKRAPWEDVRYCTEDASFRVRPWRRYWSSRRAGVFILKDRHADDEDWYPGKPRIPSGWSLSRPELLPSGRVRACAWNPAKGSAIVDECGGHPPTPEWVPGSCHHRADWNGTLDAQCFCIPPWAAEPPWGGRDWTPEDEDGRPRPPTAQILLAWDALRRADTDELTPRTIYDLLREYREARGLEAGLLRAGAWWAG